MQPNTNRHASKAKAKTAAPAFFDPAKVEDLFGLQVRGDCMAPEIADGDTILVHRDVQPKAGDLGVFFFKPEFVPPGDLQAKIKRLVTNIPKTGLRPFAKGSTVAPVLQVEDAKGRYYIYECSNLLAVCKAEIPDENVSFHQSAPPKKALLAAPKPKSKRRARR